MVRIIRTNILNVTISDRISSLSEIPTKRILKFLSYNKNFKIRIREVSIMEAVAVSPEILAWAERRSGRGADIFREKFDKWDEWLTSKSHPSFSQLKKISNAARVPIGYFFLSEPPVEDLPIPDFRVGRDHSLTPSSDLLDTIYLNQRRQSWYEDYLADFGDNIALDFVGSCKELSVIDAAKKITNDLGYSLESRQQFKKAEDAKSSLIESFEKLGGLTVLSSIVGNATNRRLNIDEFRGFTLHSLVAPLVFVNSNDTINGQIFSLLHEFAHIWRGETGVSQTTNPFDEDINPHEKWCDAVASEIAVPSNDLRESFVSTEKLTNELDRLANRYRCSTLVVLLKLRDIKLIDSKDFSALYEEERDRLLGFINEQKTKRGNFYHSQRYRVGRTLSLAIIRDTKAGRTPMTEALRLLSFSKTKTFDTYAKQLEVV